MVTLSRNLWMVHTIKRQATQISYRPRASTTQQKERFCAQGCNYYVWTQKEIQPKRACKSGKFLQPSFGKFRVEHQLNEARNDSYTLCFMSDNNTSSKHSDVKLVPGLSIYTKRGNIISGEQARFPEFSTCLHLSWVKRITFVAYRVEKYEPELKEESSAPGKPALEEPRLGAQTLPFLRFIARSFLTRDPPFWFLSFCSGLTAFSLALRFSQKPQLLLDSPSPSNLPQPRF